MVAQVIAASSGRMADAPWGTTLAAFALQRCTGELVVTGEDKKAYRIAFSDGVVVAASSPLAVDSIARVALTSHLITSSQVPAITKRLAAVTDRDEIDVVTEIAKLPVEHAVKLRQRVITQRAARTFAVEHGDYQFTDAITLSVVSGIDVDIRAAIYLGIHMNLSEVRLAEDMRRLGSRFRLRDGAAVSAFGFSETEAAIVESLRAGASLPELDANHRDVVPRTQQAVVYALVACGACEVTDASMPEISVPAREATVTDLESRTKTTTWKAPDRPVAPATRPTNRNIVEVSRARTQSGGPAIPRTITPRRNVFAVRDTIAHGLALLETGADQYALLGVERDAPLDVIRSAYVALACQLHRDKLPVLDFATTEEAHRVFAAVNLAFATLTDPDKRAAYDAELAARPGIPTVDNATLADVAFRRGMLALKREDLVLAIEELVRASDLAPADVDYAAMLAWARFCASSDKRGIANDVRRTLHSAVMKSPKPMTARFYLGRVERMLGRVREAIYHFREVLDMEPGHADAAAELRLLEARSARR